MRRHLLVLLTSSLAMFAPIVSPAAQAGRKEPPRPVTPAMKLPRMRLAEVLILGPVQASIGSEDEEGPYMFSSIGSMARGGDGTIYVGEFSTFEIRAFDQRGRHHSSFGRRGRGPGEFVQPFALHHDGDTTLFAPQGTFGVTEMTARGADVRYRRTFGTGTGYGSLCTMGRRLFATVGADSGIVRELDAERREVRAFGAPFGNFDDRAAERMSNSWAATITCDSASAALYVSRRDLGVVRRYDPDGALRWETTVPSFTPSWFVPAARGASVLFPLDQITSVIPVGRTRLIVQIETVSFEQGRATRRGMTVAGGVVGRTWYLLDVATGTFIAKVDGREPLSLLSSGLVIVAVEDPWPQVRVRPMRPTRP